jgi:hypothetical protein
VKDVTDVHTTGRSEHVASWVALAAPRARAAPSSPEGVSARSLQAAAGRLKLGQPGGPAEGRVALLHGALTYRDARWHGVDAAVLAEVVEHLDADRLPALAGVVFGAARPRTVIVTTPNAEYNALFPTLPAGALDKMTIFRHIK